MVIERADYTVTVPDGCTIEEEDPDIDLDHYTGINMPNRDFMVILVNDDKRGGDKEFESLKNNYWKRMKDPAELPSDLFAAFGGKATIVAGKMNGMKFCFEFGMIIGREKAFILSYMYEQNHPEQGRAIFQDAIASFAIKE